MYDLHLIASVPSHRGRHVDADDTARRLSSHATYAEAHSAGLAYLRQRPRAWVQIVSPASVEDVRRPSDVRICCAPIDDSDNPILCGELATTERTSEGVIVPMCAEHAAEMDADAERDAASPQVLHGEEISPLDIREAAGDAGAVLVWESGEGDARLQGWEFPAAPGVRAISTNGNSLWSEQEPEFTDWWDARSINGGAEGEIVTPG